MGRVIYFIYILYLVGAGFYMSKVSIAEEKVVRIGVLSQNEDRLEKFEGLRDELSNLNYQEGKDVVYEVMTAPNDYAEMDQLAEKLVSQKFDVLVASGEGETRSLSKTVAKLNNPPPIIFMGALSPIAIGLVESEVIPGTNVTGLNNYHYELIAKRLDLLKRLIPHVEEVAVLGDRRTNLFQDSQQGLAQTARELNISYKMYDISIEQDIPRIVNEISKTSQAILIMPGLFLETHTKAIASYGLIKGVPVFGVYPSDAEKGCIASYGTSYYNQGAQTAHMVHKIIMGYSPKSIPVETAEKLSFTVNLEVAQKLGISLEEAYIYFADKVIGQGGYQ
ncbi:ABC transporter substrate-binding protein [Desulfosporosinus sp. HMP52]|nr:ABC transporter substrate-binding protein [Desulfosporosinus sp. HMP52]